MNGARSLDRQTDYWDRVAWEKEFTHPLDAERLRRHLSPNARILDVGCGYGRLCAELVAAGFPHVTGMDISSEMIRRGKGLHPHLDLRVLEDMTAFPDSSFDALLLFAVLTCIPSDEGQDELMAQAFRVLKPDGLLYLSSYPLQEDRRSRERYAAFAPPYTYGVFELPEGTVVRHMNPDRIRTLVSPFRQVEFLERNVLTMNGNPCKIIQYLGRKSR